MNMNRSELVQKTEKLQGPILVLGAGGFVGANIFRRLLSIRKDVYGTIFRSPAWRLENLPGTNIISGDLLVESSVERLLEDIYPKTIFNCLSYGAYSFQNNYQLIYRTNINISVQILEKISQMNISCYVQAGTSSEYGRFCSGPSEAQLLQPNSHYSVSKSAAAGLVYYMGKERNLPCLNLRFYSIYGPYEDSSRLIPTLIIESLNGSLPKFVSPSISRDFIYIDDVYDAFVTSALNIKPTNYGESFNIGTGKCTTIKEVAMLAKKLFKIDCSPEFTMENREWDVTNWFANSSKAETHLSWKPTTDFETGLIITINWFKTLKSLETYKKKTALNKDHIDYSISAIVACFKDSEAIPVLYKRLTAVLTKLDIDYEIIFVNDCSPDNSKEIITKISSKDHRVVGVNHTRNFGSQSAFRSGMSISSKNACVLLDGDLQDPPELIEQFYLKWKEGFDVVYGRRIKREGPWYMSLSYKLFYRLFNYFSYLKIPHDAGDFSLIDKKVVKKLLQFPERSLFIRGIRAYVGFKQTGVDYIRPERMFGRTTNNFFKNLDWAKIGIVSFSRTPLNVLTLFSIFIFVLVLFVIFIQILAKLCLPNIAPKGITTLLLTTMFFGSSILMAVSVVGEYISRIFDEVKRRPHYVLDSIIKEGKDHSPYFMTTKSKDHI